MGQQLGSSPKHAAFELAMQICAKSPRCSPASERVVQGCEDRYLRPPISYGTGLWKARWPRYEMPVPFKFALHPSHSIPLQPTIEAIFFQYATCLSSYGQVRACYRFSAFPIVRDTMLLFEMMSSPVSMGRMKRTAFDSLFPFIIKPNLSRRFDQ